MVGLDSVVDAEDEVAAETGDTERVVATSVVLVHPGGYGCKRCHATSGLLILQPQLTLPPSSEHPCVQ